MADQRKKEIRRVLMGIIAYEMDGAVIVAAEKMFNMEAHALSAGADKVRLLGVSKAKRQYQVSGNLEKAHEACIWAFAQVGRKVFLRSAPNALCALRSPIWGPPVLASLEADEDRLNMELFTARSIFAGIRIRRMVKAIEELFPDSVKLMESRGSSEKKDRRTEK